MSIHAKFNPKGVKGRNAQPPHKIFNFMIQYHINRETKTPQGSLTKFVKAFDYVEEALDELYRQAKRHGYEVAVDNSVDAGCGFCLWQIHVKVGNWRYFVTKEDEDSLTLLGF